MDHQAKDLDQIATWLREEGLAPDSSKDTQLCLLWRTLQHTEKRLSDVTKDLQTNRSQHFAELAEVRKSLEQIRIFTEQKDLLAQEIQDENDRLRKQLQHFVSLQDAQISEVAKMLYQQGLTELIPSSASEQVAYLLVERASLLETNEDPYKLMADGNTESCPGIQAQNIITYQSSQKRASRHLQSAWKRIFGLHKTTHNKHTFIPSEAVPLPGRTSSLETTCSRLERDVEEGSRRLAMAHNEIRHLTDELESAHLTQRAYEPELQSAQQEVMQLRQEVGKLKKVEMVELRKAKELNDRLDFEIRALRDRVRSLDSEKRSLQQTGVSLQEEIDRLRSALQGHQEGLSRMVQVHQVKEKNQVECLQMKTKRLQSALQNQKIISVQVQANQAAECEVDFLQKEVERLESALKEQQQLCIVLHHADRANEPNKIRCCQLVENYHSDLNNFIAKICTKDNHEQYQKRKKADLQLSKNTNPQMEISLKTKRLQSQLCEESMFCKACPDCKEARKALLSAQNQCETLKKEMCETLKCLDKQRSKYYSMREEHKAKLCQAKQRIKDEITWRDEKIKTLQRELSLCSLSLAKEREVIVCMTVENEKLLSERRKLLEQLNKEEQNRKESSRTASLSKCRVDCLEMENKKLENKLLLTSNQKAILERSLQNVQSLNFAEQELQKVSSHQQQFTSVSAHPSRVISSEILGLLDGTQISETQLTDLSSSPCSLSRTAELGYLNLTSTQSLSDHLDTRFNLVHSNMIS